MRVPGVSVYKPSVRSEAHHRYHVAYKRGGQRIVETVSSDPRVTIEYAMALSRRLERERLGLITPEEARVESAAARPLAEHLSEFRALLLAKQRTPKRAGEVHARLVKLFGWCGFERISDLSSSRVVTCVAERREGDGWSANTCNKYLKDAAQFGRWLHRDNRVDNEPLRHLVRYDEEGDRRLMRRALTVDELARLLVAASKGKRFGIRGRDRRMLYLLAAYTGLRLGELASLTRDSFDLTGTPPTVTVRAPDSKNRKPGVVPLRRDVALAVSAWLPKRPAVAPVLRIPDKAHRMLYRDLEAAGIPRKTPEGQVDFHALRHTFGTILAAGGVPPTVLVALMRHGDYRMTMRYVHPDMGGRASAIETLPPLSGV